ncbi:MAG: helicase-related protein [Candidatus Wallbacteria bacterium]|nr:helicase-related protein [Candidatus Wallbacteria bacterium]
MSNDRTFITNENGKSLLDRFEILIKDTRFFDVLVGYFFTSGFHALYKSLETTEKIRILIGIDTDYQTSSLIRQVNNEQVNLQFSHAETKLKFANSLSEEMEKSEDQPEIEEGVLKFMNWLKSRKLVIKAYPSRNIHAKVYIMTFKEGDRDIGRVITGSSNFTQAGLIDNLEFNVELDRPTDYEFAQEKFKELWENAVDVGEKYLETIKTRTWLNDEITPYELYLKFLYEYFREKINLDQESISKKYLPRDFLDLEFQSEAVKDAKSKLEEYGGVFLSDVVGLGKTYISALLAQQLDGRTLVIAPPLLVDKNIPGSWPNVFRDFGLCDECESLGKLDDLIRRGTERYANIFIDEAHRFRTESTETYEKLAMICRGKKVILVSATPFNNHPKDLLALIKLFQKGKKSDIPNLPDLESFFSGLEKKLKGLDRQKDYKKFIAVVKENAGEIREKVLKYLMVRRTRSEIVKYFGENLAAQKLKFPEVADPNPVYYQLNENEDFVFNKTIELVTTGFKYARYTPLLYLRKSLDQLQTQSQKNMMCFMRTLLVKRLESSFHAFRMSLQRFIKSYDHFIREFDKGFVYLSKDYSGKIFDYLESDDPDAIRRLIDEEKAEKYDSCDFKDNFRDDLLNDHKILLEISKLWEKVKRDPKLLTFKDYLSNDPILKDDNKLILFTESKETAEYLHANLSKIEKTLVFSSGSSESERNSVTDNFDARARNKKDDYRILISTEVLSEGVNLHRSNIVINYDIPWNPTRMMQRVGRINRVDTKFDEIYTYNFFPTVQSNDQIKLKEAAQAKIEAFITMLGSDARLLTKSEEIESFNLFSKLTSKRTITGEDENESSELKYLKVIRDLRDNDKDLFEKVKKLPKKCRSARASDNNGLVTFFRRGKLNKFYLSDKSETRELDFFSAAVLVEAEMEEKRDKIGPEFYSLLNLNKKQFEIATTEELQIIPGRIARDNAMKILRILKSKDFNVFQGFTDDDELFIKDTKKLIEDGNLPRQTAQRLIAKIGNELNPLRILGFLRTEIHKELFTASFCGTDAHNHGQREVILSEFLSERSDC